VTNAATPSAPAARNPNNAPTKTTITIMRRILPHLALALRRPTRERC
jgi:hypothetical protein